MCYRMMEKHSAALQKGMDTKLTATDKADKAIPIGATASRHGEDSAYAAFRARYERWLGKKEAPREEESTS